MEFIPDERDALKRGIGMLTEEDLFVVIVDKVTETLDMVRDLLAAPTPAPQ
jgi:hypothetical protein